MLTKSVILWKNTKSKHHKPLKTSHKTSHALAVLSEYTYMSILSALRIHIIYIKERDKCRQKSTQFANTDNVNKIVYNNS